MNKKRFLSISILAVMFFLPVLVMAATNSAFTYTPMEQIPGFTTNGNFYNYIGIVYKFGLWVVGVCAMFMIGIGGYMYVISAGNSASMSKAKGVIFDAVAGLILALLSYLILFEINPNLVRLDGGSVGGGASTTSQSTPVTTPTGATGASCPGHGGGADDGDAAIRTSLESYGISINKADCPTSCDTNCTSVAGLPQNTIDNLKKIKDTCGSFTLTGGTESGHQAHGIGKSVVDIHFDPTLATCVRNNVATLDIARICTTPEDQAAYGLNCSFPEPVRQQHLSFN